jgi:hypothetical protein
MDAPRWRPRSGDGWRLCGQPDAAQDGPCGRFFEDQRDELEPTAAGASQRADRSPAEPRESRAGGNHQTLLNDALRAYIGGQREPLESVVRCVVKQELRRALPAKRRGAKSAEP